MRWGRKCNHTLMSHSGVTGERNFLVERKHRALQWDKKSCRKPRSSFCLEVTGQREEEHHPSREGKQLRSAMVGTVFLIKLALWYLMKIYKPWNTSVSASLMYGQRVVVFHESSTLYLHQYRKDLKLCYTGPVLSTGSVLEVNLQL